MRKVTIMFSSDLTYQSLNGALPSSRKCSTRAKASAKFKTIVYVIDGDHWSKWLGIGP